MPPTVVKANYLRTGNLGKLKASARYYAHRPDLEGERSYRDGFSGTQDVLSKDDVYRGLEDADQVHDYHYRIVLAPGADAEADGGDLKAWTREVMAELGAQQDGQLSWVAFEHAYETSHTEHAHVHVIASTDQTLSRSTLDALRERGTQNWDVQLEELQELSRDAMGLEPDYETNNQRFDSARQETQTEEVTWEQ